MRVFHTPNVYYSKCCSLLKKTDSDWMYVNRLLMIILNRHLLLVCFLLYTIFASWTILDAHFVRIYRFKTFVNTLMFIEICGIYNMIFIFIKTYVFINITFCRMVHSKLCRMYLRKSLDSVFIDDSQ